MSKFDIRGLQSNMYVQYKYPSDVCVYFILIVSETTLHFNGNITWDTNHI